MKSAAALLLATLVVASGLAAAQSGSESESEDPDASDPSSSSSSSPPSSSSSTSSSPPSSRPPEPCADLSGEEQRECRQQFCRDHPADPRCPRPTNGNTSKGPSSRPPQRDDDPPAACDLKGNPLYCRELFCREHGNATFCRNGDLRERLKEAAQNRRLGAEVELKRGHGNESVKMLRYDNVTVEVSGTDRLATEADPLTIRLSSELAEARTFSFTVNASLLPDGDAERLVLRYYDVRDDGSRTEVVLAKADSLADILDTSNDKGQPEFWVVSDANGVQVLLFVPHWSIHELTIAGLGALVQPSVLVGLAVGVVASAVLAVALFVPRRRDD